MKKLLTVILIFIMSFTLVACGNNNSRSTKSNESTQTGKDNDSNKVSDKEDGNSANANNNTNKDGEQTMAGSKKILVVYFSYTGNTRNIANQIHEKVGGDIVEIEPVTPYSTDYKTVENQGLKEENEDYKPEIKTKVDNIESYDAILIGSPIWWYQIAPPVKTFLDQNNLSGKKVALFTTNGGYGKGKSDDNIAKLCQKATILKSISIEGEKVDSSQKEVSDWLHELGLV